MMPHLLRLLLVTLCLLFALPSDAARRRLPDVVEDALAFALTDRDKAVRLLEDALAGDPPARDVDAITVYLAEQHRLAGSGDVAARMWREVIERATRGADHESARLGITLLEAGTLKRKTVAILEDVSEKEAIDTQNADRYLLLAVWSAREDDSKAAAQYSRKALQYAKEDPEVFERVKTTLEQLADGDAPGAPVDVPGAAPTGESPLDRADAALYAGDRDEARKIAERVLEKAPPDAPRRRAAEYLLRRIDGAPMSRRVAVLLPLADAKYSAVGRQLKEAFELGYEAAGGSVAVTFIESGATPEAGVAAIEKAVLEEGAMLVVGPLLTPQTDAVVEAAEALRVPLVSLSQALEDLSELRWTVQGMVTRRDQVEALVEQVMGRDGMDAFAVFAPKSAYGDHATAVFKELVEARGGRITVTGTYDPKSTSLIPDAKALGRKDYDARASEFYKLRKEAAEKGGDPARVVLPPVLDFDALFLPENANRVPIACAALAYEEFPMGDFQPTKESPRIPLLGLSGWNNAKLVTTGGPYTRGGIFVDAFAVPTPDAPWSLGPEQAAFLEDYRAAYGRTPSALEAITADAGRLVAAVVGQGGTDRLAVREALWSAEAPGAVTGATRFDQETRRAARDLILLSLTEDHIVPLQVQRKLPGPQDQ